MYLSERNFSLSEGFLADTVISTTLGYFFFQIIIPVKGSKTKGSLYSFASRKEDGG